MIDKSKIACFSGHRKLPEDCEELRKSLEAAITELIKKGVMYFGSGGALGFDMLAEETVIHMKQQYPQIRLILVLPCPPEQQTLKWNAAQREQYNEIMSKADKVRILSPAYTPGCMPARNRHLVDNSGHLVCFLRQNSGGTFYTVNYAEKQGLNILRL